MCNYGHICSVIQRSNYCQRSGWYHLEESISGKADLSRNNKVNSSKWRDGEIRSEHYANPLEIRSRWLMGCHLPIWLWDPWLMEQHSEERNFFWSICIFFGFSCVVKFIFLAGCVSDTFVPVSDCYPCQTQALCEFLPCPCIIGNAFPFHSAIWDISLFFFVCVIDSIHLVTWHVTSFYVYELQVKVGYLWY